MTTASRPVNVPTYAVRRDNPDGSVSWVWKDEDGFNTLTVNCPPAPPIYFDPHGPIPIPPTRGERK